MQDIEAIAKTRDNTQQHYKFRGIDDVYNAVNPLLKKHRVFMTSEVLERSREERQTKNGGTLIFTILLIKWKFYAEDGSCVESTSQGEGMDSADKGSNKAMSTSQKYAIIQAFAIPLEDGNPDTDNHNPVFDKDELENMKLEIKRFTEEKLLVEWANNQKEWLGNKEFVAAVQAQQKALTPKKK